MSNFENKKPNRNIEVVKSQQLIDKIHALGVENIAYTISNQERGEATLALNHPDGRRVLVIKKLPNVEHISSLIKDTCVTVFPGTSGRSDFRQIDYNFNQFGDGLFRKRILSEGHGSIPRVSAFDTEDEFARKALETLVHVREQASNLQLEEEMNINNTTIGVDEVDEVISLLDESEVVDPRNGYKPVEG